MIPPDPAFAEPGGIAFLPSKPSNHLHIFLSIGEAVKYL
jgi:hypothetical protein